MEAPQPEDKKHEEEGREEPCAEDACHARGRSAGGLPAQQQTCMPQQHADRQAA